MIETLSNDWDYRSFFGSRQSNKIKKGFILRSFTVDLILLNSQNNHRKRATLYECYGMQLSIDNTCCQW